MQTQKSFINNNALKGTMKKFFKKIIALRIQKCQSHSVRITPQAEKNNPERLKEYIIMHRVICLILFCSLIFGCAAKAKITQVNDDVLIFGHYKFSPPKGYWYFPRRFPEKFETSKDIFLVTFWSNKEAATINLAEKPEFINFAISTNLYKDFDSYYEAAKLSGIVYEKLPDEAYMLENIPGWSCKHVFHGLHGIECVKLIDNLITIGAYGTNRNELLAKAPIIRKMTESFTTPEK